MTVMLNQATSLFGVESVLLRHAARELVVASPFTAEELRFAFTANRAEGASLLQQLREGGYIEPTHHLPDRFNATNALHQLAVAKRGNGIARDEADRLLDKVVDSAHQYNQTPNARDGRIVCVVVFGSYLTDKPVLGDVDIGFELSAPPPGFNDMTGFESIDAYFRRIFGPEERAKTALRVRRPNQISVHPMREVLRLETPYRVIFGALPQRAQGTQQTPP